MMPRLSSDLNSRTSNHAKGSIQILRLPHQVNLITMTKYNRDESGVKYHSPNHFITACLGREQVSN